MSKPLHITAIAPYPIFPANTGGQKNIVSFYNYLAEELPLTVISTKHNGAPEWKGIDFKPILGRSPLRYVNPFLFFKIKKIIKENKTTHLLIEHPYYGWLGLLLQWFCKCPLIIHSHNIEAIRFKSIQKWWWGILWNYEKFTHQHAAINFFITEEDRAFAIKHYKLTASKCFTITYGFDFTTPPDDATKAAARAYLQQTHHIPEHHKILFFNGTLDYQPNLLALDLILEKLQPLLQQNAGFAYTFLICGKNLPTSYDSLKAYASENIVYTGFVPDIGVYYTGADIFVNPVTEGGGIKTKLVEALGHDMYSISTQKGAYGVPVAITGDRLQIVADHDWKAMAAAITNSNDKAGKVSNAFFDHFYWRNIAKKAAECIRGSRP